MGHRYPCARGYHPGVCDMHCQTAAETCASMWRTVGKKEKLSSLSIMKKDVSGTSRVVRSSLLPVASLLWLSISSRDECSCPWFILPLENMGTILASSSTGEHEDVQRLCRSVPATHWLSALENLENWLHLLSVAALGRAGPAPQLGSTVELALVARVCMNLPNSVNLLELTLPLFSCGIQPTLPSLSVWSCEMILEWHTEGS